MHNAAFAALGLNRVYLALPVPPNHLHGAVQGLRAWQLPGANVTIPHKEAIVPLLDGLCPNAERVLAVNTLFWLDGQLLGDNTDVTGLMIELLALRSDWRGTTAVIIGSGGAARAAAVALGDLGAVQIGLLGRNLEAGVRVTAAMGRIFPDIQWTCHTSSTAALLDLFTQADVVVNATPVGMVGQASGLPLERRLIELLNPGAIVYDMVYNPERTPLVTAATDRGLLASGGLGMLVQQGAAAFTRWTDQPAPVEVMRQAVKGRLAAAVPDA